MSARLTMLCHGRTTARPSSFPGDEVLLDGEAARIAAVVGKPGATTRCMVSPARAALQTAEALGVSADVDTALADLDLGEWRAKAIRDIEGSSPEALYNWMEEPDFTRHGGESRQALAARISIWLDGRMAADQSVLAITHPAVIQMALVQVMGAPLAAFRHVDVHSLCRLELGSDGRRWSLRAFG